MEVVNVTTQAALAEELGVERKSISRWSRKKGCPGKGENGYNVRRWKQWIADEGLGRKSRRGKQRLEEEKLELGNEKLRIAVAKERGELLGIDEVCQVLSDMMSGFVLTLRQSVPTMAEEAVGVTPGEAVKRIRHRLDEAMAELALGEWAKKKAFWSTVYARLLDLQATHDLGRGPRRM